MPAWASASLYFPMAARSSVLGSSPASDALVALTMTMTFITPSFFQLLPTRSHARSVRRRFGDHHHPAQTEAVGDHAVARRPERPGERHLDAPAVGEGVERPPGVRLLRDGEGQPHPVELRPVVAPVGRHERYPADAK